MQGCNLGTTLLASTPQAALLLFPVHTYGVAEHVHALMATIRNTRAARLFDNTHALLIPTYYAPHRC
jgi:hypothetical protein